MAAILETNKISLTGNKLQLLEKFIQEVKLGKMIPFTEKTSDARNKLERDGLIIPNS